MTDRLVLRGWRDDDKPPDTRLNADPVVMQHFPSTLTAPQSDEMVDRMPAAWEVHGDGLWAVELVGSGGFIGFSG